MIRFALGDPERLAWQKDGVRMSLIRIPVIRDDQYVGYVDVWPDLSPNMEPMIGTVVQIGERLSPEQVEAIGFRTSMRDKSHPMS